MSQSTHAGTRAATAHLTESERHRLLAAARRREALAALAGRERPIELAELAASVAARETGLDETDAVTTDRVARSLHHVHLPAIADAGLVDYDPERNRVEPRPGVPDS